MPEQKLFRSTTSSGPIRRSPRPNLRQRLDGKIHPSDVQGGYSGTDNIDIDPLFVPGDSLFDLTALSPCIGRGVDSMPIGRGWYLAPRPTSTGIHVIGRPDSRRPI